jgi:type II secretory pathway predicted ATPase ExeA
MYLRISPYKEILQGILTDLEVNEGIIKVTGKSGAGKTELCIQLCQDLRENAQPVVLFPKPPANATALQNEILTRLNLDLSGNFTRTLTAYLVSHANPKQLVLIFDDAHQLDQQTFSAIRMLCNIQSRSRALIRVIICGNAELDTKLATPALRAVAQFLSQSVTVPYLTLSQVHDFCEAYWRSQNVDMKPLGEKAQQKLLRETQGRPGILQTRLNQGSTGADKIEHGKNEAAAAPQAPFKYARARAAWLPRLLIILALILLACTGAWFYFTRSSPNGTEIAAPIVAADDGLVPLNASPPENPAPVVDVAEADVADAEQVTALETLPDVEIAAENPSEAPVESAESAEPDVAETITTEGANATENVAVSSVISVETFLASWTESWQSHDVDRYLAAYHENFAPPQGLTRGEWEEWRRRMISSAQDIVIEVESPELNTEVQDGMRLVRFWLNYSAANYADRTLKELLLVPVDGSWRIRAESNLRIARL